MMHIQNSLRTSPGYGISGHAPGARSRDGAMRASGGRLNFKIRRPTGTNPKKLRLVTSKERTVASDGPANYHSRIEGVARRLNGKFDRKCYRNREQEQKLHIGTWNATLLTSKEPELVDETIRYRLDIVGVSSTKRKGNGTLVLNRKGGNFSTLVLTQHFMHTRE